MMKLRWAILFTALTVFLTACPGTSPTELGVSLKATPTSLTAPGKVTLEATVTGGPADQVEFFNGSTSINKDTTEPYSFEVASLAATATFKAVATKGGVTANSANVQVTVGSTAVALTLAANPNPVPAGGAPVALTATITAGADKVKSVEFSVKGQTAVLNKDTTSPYSFTTTTPVTAATTFVATAKDAAGATLGTPAEVAVTVGSGTLPGSGATVQATTLQQIKDAPENANIQVQNNILCADPNQDAPTPQFPDGDPCIELKPGQKLAAATPGLKITTDIPIKFGNSTDEAKSTVIKMAGNTAVEGFTFDGPDMYTAIEAAAAITGPVYITNVTISTPTSNNAVSLKSVGDLTINGLTFTTTRQVFIQDFKKATITGLNLTVNRDLAATGTALNIQSDAATSEAIIDGLNLTTNLGGTGKDGVLIQNSADTTVGGNMTVTVKNSVVTFGTGADLANSIAFNFNKVGTGTYTIKGADSQGNSSNSTYAFEATYGAGVTGGPIGIQ
jgi:Bacterial Ig domain